MKLYQTYLSPFATRVRLLLYAKGIDVDIIEPTGDRALSGHGVDVSAGRQLRSGARRRRDRNERRDLRADPGPAFDGRFEDRDYALDAFRRHEEGVRAEIPTERLIVWEAAQGWEPLCAALGCAVKADST